jgi:hypothetical protein
MTSVVEIAADVYRLCTYNPDSGLQFCQFLFKDHEPLLFHAGHRRLFPEVREAVARVIDPTSARWIGHSHFEADECGSLNEWLELAPRAESFCAALRAQHTSPTGDSLPFTSETEAVLEQLTDTNPRALATHHGSTYMGDGKKALLDLIQVLREVHTSTA